MDIQSASVIAAALAIGLAAIGPGIGQGNSSGVTAASAAGSIDGTAILFDMFMSLMGGMSEDVCDEDDSEFNDEANLVSIVENDDFDDLLEDISDLFGLDIDIEDISYQIEEIVESFVDGNNGIFNVPGSENLGDLIVANGDINAQVAGENLAFLTGIEVDSLDITLGSLI